MVMFTEYLILVNTAALPLFYLLTFSSLIFLRYSRYLVLSLNLTISLQFSLLPGRIWIRFENKDSKSHWNQTFLPIFNVIFLGRGGGASRVGGEYYPLYLYLPPYTPMIMTYCFDIILFRYLTYKAIKYHFFLLDFCYLLKVSYLLFFL